MDTFGSDRVTWLNELEQYMAREARMERTERAELLEGRMCEPAPEPIANVHEVEPRLNPYVTCTWLRCPACYWWSFVPTLGVREGDNGCWCCAKCNANFDIQVFMRRHQDAG